MTDQQREEHSGNAAPGDDAFASTAGRMLRERADDLDAATVARLNRARQVALDQLPERRAVPGWVTPALSAAAIGALAVALWVSQGAAPDRPAPPAITSAADTGLLPGEDGLEMLEDLDFYAWLDADLNDDKLRAELEPAS